MKKKFFRIMVTVGVFLFLVMLLVITPLSNEDWLHHKLKPTFEEFSGITSEKYPDKTEKNAAFARVLEKKAQIVEANTLPFITCEAKFIARNPGTIHRKDVRTVSCSWGSL